MREFQFERLKDNWAEVTVLLVKVCSCVSAQSWHQHLGEGGGALLNKVPTLPVKAVSTAELSLTFCFPDT